MMWWRRRSRERQRWHERERERIPDGDTVLAPGQRRWADLLAEHTTAEERGKPDPLAELTQQLAIVTPAASRRGRGDGR